MKNPEQFKNKLTKPEMNQIRGGDGEVEIEETILTPDELSTVLKVKHDTALATINNVR